MRLVKVNFYSKVWNRFPQTYKDLICYIAYRFAGVAAYRLGGKILKWHMSSGHMQRTWPVNSFEMTNGVNVYSLSPSSKNQAQIPLSLPPPLFVSKLRKPIINPNVTYPYQTHSPPWQTRSSGLAVRACGKTELEDVGSDFGQYLDPGGIKEPGPQRVLYLLFGGLGLVHRSCIGLITNQVVHKTWILQHIRIHTCKYTHTHILQSKRLRNNKEIKKKQIRMPGILRK